MSDPISQFLDEMNAYDVLPASASDIVADGKWHSIKLASDKPKRKTGYYRLTIDGDFAVGQFGDRRIGETHTWHNKLNGRDYTEEERREYKERVEALNKAREIERKKLETDAALDAKLVWDGAEYAKPDHPYLVRKQIHTHCFKQHKGKLLIPMWSDKKLYAYQSIDEDGEKLYLENARKKGCYCPLMSKGESLDVILFAEGAATGATVREVTQLPTMICFDAGNIEHVVADFRKRYPSSLFYICADNDAWQRLKPTDPERVFVGPESKLNVGIHKATQAAIKHGKARAVWPAFEPEDHPDRPTDFNDLKLIVGEDAVRQRIEEALSSPMPEPAEQDLPVPDVKSTKLDSVIKKNGDWTDLLICKVDNEGNQWADPAKSSNYNVLAINNPNLRGVFRWDEFQICVIVAKCPPWTPIDKFKVHKLEDNDIYNCDYYMQSLGMNGSFTYTRAAIYTAAAVNPVNPPREYFDSIVWDGTPRLDNWLKTYAGAIEDDPEYVRAVGRTWLIAAVKRVYEPGCKFDHMLILEGKQGAGKSTLLKDIATFGTTDYAESYFTDTFQLKNSENKDELSKLKGVLVVEIQELAGFNKKDRDSLTAFVTTVQDEYRAPYGFENKKYPRQFVLAGTYNPVSGLFTDPTGYRRFWCVAVDKIDNDGLRRDREQLWAEAVKRYKEGAGLVLSEELYKKAEAAGEARRVDDDWTSAVLNFARGRSSFEVREVLQALGIETSRQTRAENLRVCGILKVHGYERKQRMISGVRMSVWERAGADVKQQEEMDLDEQEIPL